MADEQTQQTRVLLLNDRTIILQGDAGDNSINDINTDLLQQALQEASAPVTGVEEPPDCDYSASIPGRNENNLVAIFQGEQGETHTIQLTIEQAEALGLQVPTEDPDKQCVSVLNPSTASTFAVTSEASHLVYPDNSIAETETNKSLFNSCVGTEVPTVNLQNDENLPDENSALQQSIVGMGVLSDVGSYVENPNNITLIPQFVNGQMTYTVKLNPPPEDILQDQEYHVLKDENELNDKNTVALLTPMHDASLSGTPVSSTSASALNTTSLPNSLTSSSFTTTRLNNVHSGLSPLPTVSSVLCPTVASNIYQNNKTNLINSPLDKSGKQSYVLVPGNSTNSMSLLTKTSPTQLMRPGKQLTQSTKFVSSVASHIPNTATLTGIPIMNSNINITRTSSAGSGLIPSVSTTLTGGGMIRVVAGGSNTNINQTTANNTPKFTNILTPSGRLVAATSGTTTSTQRVISLSTTADSLKSTTSAVATSASAIPATSTSQSAAVTNAPSNSVSAISRVNINSSKPLGSSENPIQLVQHGQTFHSVQALSQEQLRQIATVLQQQHLDSAPRTKNVLYDAETNTRIIYRVVYPEDLDLREANPSNSSANSNSNTASITGNSSGSSGKLHLSSSALVASGRGRGRRGRPRGSGRPALNRGSHEVATAAGLARKHSAPSSADMDVDEDQLAHDPSKMERRKQLQLARTRSGRLSRPPRHMVKDYKRLHYLDFADADVDDSDGGYSDYQTSDREPEDAGALALSGAAASSEAGTGLGAGAGTGVAAVADAGTGPLHTSPAALSMAQPTAPKRKISSHFRCPTCQKIYLGHSRMARHFEMFPDHGSIEQLKARPASVPTLPQQPSLSDSKTSSSPTVNGVVRGGPVRRRGKRRGPWAYMTPEARSERRKLKLREVLTACEVTELSEVAGPAVARSMSLWELLLLRVEAVRTEESLVATLCDELRSLLDKVQAVASEVLQPADSDPGAKEEHLELQDELLSQALGLPCGRYQVVDEYLLSSRQHRGLEPPSKRLRSSPARSPTPSPCASPSASDRPACPEVLSALALDPKRPPAPQALSSPPQHTISPESPGPPDLPLNEGPEPSQDPDETAEADAASVTDHFLLPECTPAPLSPAEASGSEAQTVDDIVNERLEKLTGFSVGEAPGGPGPVVSSALASSVRCSGHTSNGAGHPEVSAFDPELALAAMGEGEQPGPVPTFEPELALVAMGEGEQVPVAPRQGRAVAPAVGATPGSEAPTFDPELALAAMGEGGDDVGPAAAASFDAEMALAAMGEPSSDPVTGPGAGSDCGASRSEASFPLAGMDVGLDGPAADLDFEALSAEFGQPVSRR